jgi:hypothetical protein
MRDRGRTLTSSGRSLTSRWAVAALATAGLAAAWAHWARVQPLIDRETALRLGRA